ncbi:MAG: DUF1801 domain-containing protein [Anaerolineaceae bacterium]|nr:DUF1801 domain-containing protein [Anaerolineaceae bacterium]
MAKLKTTPNNQDVTTFLNGVANAKRREDSFAVLALMQEVTGYEPRLWGDSIVGFGSYHYKYASGHEGDSFLAGFSPRKQSLTLYIMAGFDQYDALMVKLGKHTTGKSCLYIKKLEDINQDVLRELVKASVEHVAETNSPTQE